MFARTAPYRTIFAYRIIANLLPNPTQPAHKSSYLRIQVMDYVFLLVRGLNEFEEFGVHAWVVAELGVECGGHDIPLPHENGVAVALG
jgi:hypothetical protein